ncbi:MAG: zinc ribbon domain-containing protein [Myxococcota bacterium]|nr:zinc ribbon domain-containing protein [Myxococcota bacterium]
MNTQASEAVAVNKCPFCGVDNPKTARFCKDCGGAIVPPDECPTCGTDIPKDAKFCPGCGIAVIGPRSDIGAATEVAPAIEETIGKPTVQSTEQQKEKAESLGAKDDLHAGQVASASALEALEKANEERRKSRGVGLGTNVLFFVSVLIAFIVGMYAWNKDKPKEASMFSGAPAPSNPANSPTAPVAVDATKSVSGSIEMDPALARSVDTNGVLYVIARNAGMPTQGPPLAVKKFAQPKFPLTFTLSGSDVMMAGMPFVGPFDLYVRLDRDGNAMTRGPNDLVHSAPSSNIKVGDQSIQIQLDQTYVAQQKGSQSSPKPSNSEKAAVSPNGFSGSIEIDRSLKAGSKLSSGTVYIIVRPAGMPPVGPPLAVRKYSAPQFPLPFQIGPEHVMMQNMPFQGPFDVYARWDADGNAISKAAGDLESSKPLKSVDKGSSGHKIVFDVVRK